MACQLKDRDIPANLHCEDLQDLLVTTETSQELGDTIIQMIETASKHIYIINPLIYDARLTRAITNARNRRVRVKLITNLRKRTGDKATYPTKGFDATNKKQLHEQYRAPRALAEHGVLCKETLFSPHAKLFIADSQSAIICSANGNSNSLGWGNEVSIEAGMKITDKDVLTEVLQGWAALWQQCPFTLHNLDGTFTLEESNRSKSVAWPLSQSSHDRLFWSVPTQIHSLLDTITKKVNAAKNDIIFVVFSFYDLDKMVDLNNALLSALERGVRVRVVVRPDVHALTKFPDPNTIMLMRQGLEVLAYPGMHAKGLVIDDTYCGIFSANINPYSLSSDLDSANVEIGYFEDCHSNSMHEFARWIRYIADSAPHQIIDVAKS